MAKTYSDVMAQITKLQAEAEALRKAEVAGVVKRIREAIDHYGLTSADRGFKLTRGARGSAARAKASAGAKYGDGQGNVWGGRGPRPAWLRDALAQGRTLEEFVLGTSTSEAGDPGPRSRKKRVKTAAAAKPTAGAPSSVKRTHTRSASRRTRTTSVTESQGQDESPQDVSNAA